MVIVKEEWIDLPAGNGTNQFQHPKLYDALKVDFYREGIIKIPNLPNDSYVWDKKNGLIQTTEIMETYQRFRIKLKRICKPYED